MKIRVDLAGKLEKSRAGDAVTLYRRVVPAIVDQTNNNAYAEAIKLIRKAAHQCTAFVSVGVPPVNMAIWLMKTTLDLPDPLFRKAKATAAERGQSLKEFVTEALEDKLQRPQGRSAPGEPSWMQGFGKLKRLHKETIRVQSAVDEEFEVIELEDRR